MKTLKNLIVTNKKVLVTNTNDSRYFLVANRPLTNKAARVIDEESTWYNFKKI